MDLDDMEIVFMINIRDVIKEEFVFRVNLDFLFLFLF